MTEKIPPLGTPVRLVFKPKLKDKGEGGVRKVEGKAKGAKRGAEDRRENEVIL